jgi:poly-beta-1,6-N-acetyl-D-glucosamine synthase
MQPSDLEPHRRLFLAVVVAFLNEEWCLPVFLESMAAQMRPPDVLVLVDDGSTDRSPEIAFEFSRDRENVRFLQLPPRAPARDRLAEANELKAFQWAVDQLDDDWDVIAKMDADLQLSDATIETIENAFASDAALGMAGVRLAESGADGNAVPLVSPPDHVEGATKFYRRACWDEISPIPAILGWDTVDEFRARVKGWRTESFVVASGDPLHLRRMGGHSPILRSFRRWGACAYGYGSHPLHVLLYSLRLMRSRRPRIIGGLNYVVGYFLAGLRQAPRAESELRVTIRRQQVAKIRRRVTALLPQRTSKIRTGKGRARDDLD